VASRRLLHPLPPPTSRPRPHPHLRLLLPPPTSRPRRPPRPPPTRFDLRPKPFLARCFTVACVCPPAYAALLRYVLTRGDGSLPPPRPPRPLLPLPSRRRLPSCTLGRDLPRPSSSRSTPGLHLTSRLSSSTSRSASHRRCGAQLTCARFCNAVCFQVVREHAMHKLGSEETRAVQFSRRRSASPPALLPGSRSRSS